MGLAAPTLPFISQAAWAEEQTLSQEQAQKLASSIFNLPAGLRNTQATLRDDPDLGRKIWDLSWESSSYRSYYGYSVRLDAITGEILNYNENTEWKSSINPVKVKGKKECRNSAETFLKKVAPSHFKESRLAKTPNIYDSYVGGPRVHTFRYERMVNGIPFPDNNMMVTVNAETGRVIGYYIFWNDKLTFPEAKSVITAEQAAEQFKKKIRLRLSYNSPIDAFFTIPTQNSKPVEPYYSQYDGLNYLPTVVDALTGKTMDIYGQEVAVKEPVSLPVLPEIQTAIPTKSMTIEEGKAVLEKMGIVPSNYTLQASDTNGYGGIYANTQMINFMYIDSDSGNGEMLNISINAKTGDLMQYSEMNNIWDNAKQHQQKYSYEQCRRIAADFVKKQCPKKWDYLYLIENPLPGRQISYINGKAFEAPLYNFNFVRIVNGIPYNMNNINVEVDNATGKINGFYSNWDVNATFIPPTGVITPEEAADKLLAAVEPTLMYTGKMTKTNTPSNETMLVYRFGDESASQVNAITGKVEGSIYADSVVKFSDIDAHWAEREIVYLATNNIIDGSAAKFNPDKQITRAEFLKMLVTAKGLKTDTSKPVNFSDVPANAWYYPVVQTAVKAGLAKGSGGKFYPEKPITNQEAVVILIKAMNLPILPNLNENWADSYKDGDKVAPWAQSSYATAADLELLISRGGWLKPEAPATRAEVAVMLAYTIERGKSGQISFFANN